MLVFYLQSAVHLPNLQELSKSETDRMLWYHVQLPKSFPHRPLPEDAEPIVYDTTFHKGQVADMEASPISQMSISDVISGFFGFYASFDFSKDIISIKVSPNWP